MSPDRENEFIPFAGELAESLSFNRSVGQIYGLLYLSPRPLSLDEVASRLSMSKGNASINLRALEEWGAVRPVSVKGTRRDYYEADRDLKRIALRRLQEGLGRRLNSAEGALSRLLDGMGPSQDPDDQSVRKRAQELRSMVSGARKALRLLPKVIGFLPK